MEKRFMSNLHDWSDAVDVLAVRLDRMGDVLMTAPALRALHQARSGRRVTLLTSPGASPLRPLLPDLHDVIAYEAPWMKATPPRTDATSDLHMITELRARHFDAAVIFTVYSQNPLPAAMMCHLADIPLRLAHCRENPYQLLTNWVSEPEPEGFVRHEVRRQLDLVAEVGCKTEDEALRVCVPEEATRWAQCMLRRLGFPSSHRLVLLHPGASAASRRYPAEGFAAAATRLALQHDCRVLLIGAEAERNLVEQVRWLMGTPAATLIGGMSLPQLAAMISLAPVLITNNTGPATSPPR